MLKLCCQHRQRGKYCLLSGYRQLISPYSIVFIQWLPTCVGLVTSPLTWSVLYIVSHWKAWRPSWAGYPETGKASRWPNHWLTICKTHTGHNIGHAVQIYYGTDVNIKSVIGQFLCLNSMFSFIPQPFWMLYSDWSEGTIYINVLSLICCSLYSNNLHGGQTTKRITVYMVRGLFSIFKRGLQHPSQR